MTLTLAIDQGTHASRALLFDARGEPLADHLLPVALSRPLPGHAEQDASGILDTVRSVVQQVLQTLPPRQRSTVRSCGLSTQRSTVVAWNSAGTPLSPALSWQDTRTADRIAALRPRASLPPRRASP